MRETGITKYSAKIKGDQGNYGWAVRFDMTDGYLGINQYGENGNLRDRVLLSPRQIAAAIRALKDKP